ncbi:MAG: hypothetical protein JWM11_7683 [Planctomycetaceae bacterium]|nr:hypothetical protein [Planctomycetaceae bacterium]
MPNFELTCPPPGNPQICLRTAFQNAMRFVRLFKNQSTLVDSRAGSCSNLKRFFGVVCIFLLPATGFAEDAAKAVRPANRAIPPTAVQTEVKVQAQPAVKAAQPAKAANAKAVPAGKAKAVDQGQVDAAKRDPSPKSVTEKAVPEGKIAERDGGKPAEAVAEAEDVEFAAVVADGNQFEQQFKKQFSGLLKAELFFLNRSCESTSEQRKELKIAGDRVLIQVVKEFGELQKKMNQGGFNWNSPTPEPRRHIQEALLIEAKLRLSPEQVALYESELTRRLENRKRTSILNVVARLDDELILTTEQRTKLTEELTAKWKTADTQQMEIFLYSEHYFPNVPEQFVTSILNEKQKEVWRGIQKNTNIFFGIGHIGNVVINEALWDDDPPGAKDAPEKKPNALNAIELKALEAREEQAKAQADRDAAIKAAAVKKEAAAKEKAEKEAAEKALEKKNIETQPKP